MNKLTISIISCFILLSIISCRDKETTDKNVDTFDRSAMLVFWADEIIIPEYENYILRLSEFQIDLENFYASPDQSSLQNLRTTWKNAYLGWQRISMFDIGKAEEIGLRNFTNIYPTDTTLIKEHINQGTYNLELPSTFVAQGFPAMDFLLYGYNISDQLIIEKLQELSTKQYMIALYSRLIELSQDVLDDWENNYRDQFVNNDGSSGTASVDKMVNDYLFCYEKFLRAGKVGIPAGVFSGLPIEANVEALYAKDISKELFNEAFSSARDFFHGTANASTTLGVSLADYVDHIMQQNGGENLVEKLDVIWNNVDELSAQLDPNFVRQINSDNQQMLSLYDEIQKSVILMKVDMLQMLNIQIDYVDADGD